MGAITPDQAEMACHLETTLFGSSGPRPGAPGHRGTMSQIDDASVGHEHPSVRHKAVLHQRWPWEGVGMWNREASHAPLLQRSARGILLSEPCRRDLCPEPGFPHTLLRICSCPWVEARGLLGGSAIGPGCASEIMQLTLVPKSSVFSYHFIHLF